MNNLFPCPNRLIIHKLSNNITKDIASHFLNDRCFKETMISVHNIVYYTRAMEYNVYVGVLLGSCT
jgi:hypothetical protein